MNLKSDNWPKWFRWRIKLWILLFITKQLLRRLWLTNTHIGRSLSCKWSPPKQFKQCVKRLTKNVFYNLCGKGVFFESLEFMCRVTYGGVVERGWVWLGEDWSSSMEGVNTRVRGFFGWVETWMSWTITVIWRSSCGVILNHFTVEWVKILDCGAPPKVNHLDNPPRGIRMICLSCSH